MKRAEITAFLSLIFVLMMSFVLAIAESAVIQTSKNYARMEADRAVFSFFGEYQKELLQEYEVFAVDASYGTGQYAEQLILNHMAYYGNTQIQQEITAIQLLTDGDGQAFREQVLAYMEEKTGIGLVKDITGVAEQWETKIMEGEKISEELDRELLQNGSLLPEEAQPLLELKKKGILSLVLPESYRLSGKTVQLEGQISNRTKQKGYGSFPVRSDTAGLKGKILFGQYLLEHFNSAVNQVSETRNLEYEMEYILGGKSSDGENLKAVIHQLLMVRLAMNYMYLLSDGQKQAEAETMALGIAAVILQPEAVELIKTLLLALWGFGESIIELRALLAGKRVALAKNAENWKLSLSSLFFIGSTGDGTVGKDEEKGLDYQQYLSILLFLQNNNVQTMRSLDRIEQNIRMENGVVHFRADACVSKIHIRNTAEIREGCTYQFPVLFGYL